jgi:hypothetical protein
LARQTNERVVIILDGAQHFFAICQLDPHRDFRLNQMLEVLYFFKGLFGSAIPGFSAWS